MLIAVDPMIGSDESNSARQIKRVRRITLVGKLDDGVVQFYKLEGNYLASWTVIIAFYL